MMNESPVCVMDGALALCKELAANIFDRARRELQTLDPSTSDLEITRLPACSRLVTVALLGLLINAEFHSAWNLRWVNGLVSPDFRSLNKGFRKKSLEWKVDQDALCRELRASRLVLLKHPKSHQAWLHR